MVRGTFGAEYRPQLPPIVAPLTEHDYIFWFNFNVAYQISVSSSYCPWLIDQLPVSVAHQILSANYFLQRSSSDQMRQVVLVVSLALCIVVLAELINNNLSAAAAGRCFVLRCDAEIGIIKEILIIEGIMAATMLWIWGECRDVFRLTVSWHLTIPPSLSCFLPQSESPVPSLLAATFYHTKFLPYK